MSARRRHARPRVLTRRTSAALLLGALAASWWLVREDVSGSGGFAGVEAAFKAVPHSIGRWHAVEVPLPAAATEILRPTAILSRRYAERGSDRVAILGIVHCGDVRDMLGHHPPRCYPAAGWIAREGGPETVTLRVDGRVVAARLDRFHRTEAQGARAEKSVLGFFLLPDGGVSADEAELGERIPRRALSEQGVAQLQVVLEGWPETGEIAERAQVLVDGLPASLFEALQPGRAPGARGATAEAGGAPRAGHAPRGGGSGAERDALGARQVDVPEDDAERDPA